MKELIKKLLDPHTTGENLDNTMKLLMKHKFDHDLKEHYKKAFQEDFNKFELDQTEKGNQTSNLLKWSFLLLVIGLISFTGYQFMKTQAPNNKILVNQYLAANQLKYHGVKRSNEAAQQLPTSKSFIAFNDGQYTEVINTFKTKSSLSLEEQFFYNFSLMKIEDFKTALAGYNTLLTQLKPSDNYFQETQLYKALCLKALDSNEYKAFVSTLPENSWEKTELAKIE